MTDERYSYVEDVKNRKNVARSGGKKGKSRYGCSLPVDYMTTKEKRDANSRWISITYDRPISFDKFLAYSDDDKRKYLQIVIDNHGGTTGRIAEMFGCTEAGVKKFRQDLDIKSPVYKFGTTNIDTLWETFLTRDEFLRKPMSYDDFKALDYYDQTQYISFLVETMGVTINSISSELFGQAKGSLGRYLKDHNISYCHNGKGYHMGEERIIAWDEWLGKNNKPEQKTEETQTVEEPKETEETESYEIPSMQAHFRIDSQDQIIEMLSKLPKARKGQIFFIWGKDN